ncbi:MotA/TolQ/ExbB proton channel family protein [Leisingera sp. XS_AS12]|uniref:MotA/TolQ/ExbB proton channel family protein n=1 Tax=Leisingera sp. XS_AS12 TaxID=3241294 RepID=UPI003511A70B
MTLRISAALAALVMSVPAVLAQEAQDPQGAPAAPPVPFIALEAPGAEPLLPGEDAATTPLIPTQPAQDVAEAAAPTEAEEAAPVREAPPQQASPASAEAPAPVTRQDELTEMASDATAKALKFLRDGGPSIWAIAALSVITLALILWKIWRLALIGAWSRGKAGKAVAAFERGDAEAALAIVKGRIGIRSRVVAAALTASATLPEDRAREETARVAKLHLASASTGLGALELIATIAPLLGLLGTVLGMIAAFQALQAAGSKADPALLAGGIWEALLTTAAGMAVAIPASAALTWFEAVIARIRQDIEDSATRIFVAREPQHLQLAAE